MLKTSSTESGKFRKNEVGVGSKSKAGCDRSEIDGREVENNEIEKKIQKTSKFKICLSPKRW